MLRPLHFSHSDLQTTLDSGDLELAQHLPDCLYHRRFQVRSQLPAHAELQHFLVIVDQEKAPLGAFCVQEIVVAQAGNRFRCAHLAGRHSHRWNRIGAVSSRGVVHL